MKIDELIYVQPEAGFSLDAAKAGITAEEMADLAGNFAAAHAGMQAIERGEIVNLDEYRAVTHFTDRVAYPKGETFAAVEDFFAKLRKGEVKGSTGKPIDAVVVNGIGGSALGPQLLQFAIRGPYWNEMTREARKDNCRIYFTDNTDSAGVADLSAVLDLEETLIVTISKSGGTRETLNNHRSAILWFTGLSGAGKSTVAHAVEERLHQLGCRTFVFDGDNVRHGLCSDLGFSADDRSENLRRIGEMVKLFLEAGVISLTAFISPFREDRERVRALAPHGDFLEIYCHCPLEVCEQRDVKGLYKRARQGEIAEFTGISSPYEEPENPELTLDTSANTLEQCVDQVLSVLAQRGVICVPTADAQAN